MNDSARRTDRELFQAVTAGDAQALAELAGRHARGLYDFALRGTLDEQQAAAVVESALLRVRRPEAQVPNQIDFRTWLYSIGLIDVLAVSNETRTARISTDDDGFFQSRTGIDSDLAHWAWQAARGLRTRDYCVLDLTLRRGLTPEEVAEAASLTRSNLYGSIGRARGAFEETFAAMVLYERGRESCAALDEMVESAPGGGLRPALRHQIIEHSDGCEACRRTLDSLPPAASVFISLADIEVPDPVVQSILDGSGVRLPPSERESDAPLATAALAGATASGALGTARNGESHPEIEGEFVDDDDQDDDEQDEDGDDPDEEVPTIVTQAPATLTDRTAFPPHRVASRPAAVSSTEAGGDRVTSVLVWGRPILWTYVLLGVLAVMAAYLGVAVADSLQSGGSDSGAVPLDSAANGASGRVIDCGGGSLEMSDGESTVVSFDEGALDGYQIRSISYVPVTEDAAFEDLEGTLENPFLIRLSAKQQDATEPRTEQFELRIEWQRGEEAANSLCPLLVHVTP
jgi:DNA-directed RNA polymerase specialized sigma24 family protein